MKRGKMTIDCNKLRKSIKCNHCSKEISGIELMEWMKHEIGDRWRKELILHYEKVMEEVELAKGMNNVKSAEGWNMIMKGAKKVRTDSRERVLLNNLSTGKKYKGAYRAEPV